MHLNVVVLEEPLSHVQCSIKLEKHSISTINSKNITLLADQSKQLVCNRHFNVKIKYMTVK